MINFVDRTYITDNGLFKILDKGNYWQVIYSNEIFKNSPFIMPTTFSKEFSYSEVLHSEELEKFLSIFK